MVLVSRETSKPTHFVQLPNISWLDWWLGGAPG